MVNAHSKVGSHRSRSTAPASVSNLVPARSVVPDDGSPGKEDELLISIVTNSRLLSEGLPPLLADFMSVRIAGSYSGTAPADVPLGAGGHAVLIDGRMDAALTLAWIATWRRREPAPNIVVFDLGSEIEHIIACIRAGATAYTREDEGVAAIATAVRDARDGLASCSPDVAGLLFRRLAQEPPPSAAPPASLLTARELELLQLIARDHSNQEIADRLVLQLSTVKHHVHNILDKLQLRHRWDAARLATERGWIEPVPSQLPTGKSN
jgi:DNA-binding NarL/FixJ family response regulator